MNSCVVVGGGLIGMLTAKELVDAGIKVTLIDRNYVGRESSWAGGGILSPLYPWRYPDAVNHLAHWSQQHYAELCQQLYDSTGIDPEYTQSGLMMLDVEDVEDASRWASKFFRHLQLISSDQVQLQEPALSSMQQGQHLLLADVAQVRNPRILQSLRAWLEQRQVEIVEQQPVTAISQNGKRVDGVDCGGRIVKSDAVVITCGAWSKSLLSGLGINLNVFPVQGQMLLFKSESMLINHILMKKGFYIIPRRDGHILAGSTMEYRGYDKQPTREAYEQLKAEALEMVPALAHCPIVKHWAGLRPGSKDGIPYISAVDSVQGLFVNSGHFRNGVVMGAASARLMVDIMLAREEIVASAPYRMPI